MLDVINLGCVRGDRRLFSGLNFTLEPGGMVEVRGPNGGGKTSLLRILCGLMTPAEGEVRWQGTMIRSVREEYLGTIAYIAHQNGIKDELTPIENVRVAVGIVGGELDKHEARAIIGRLGLKNQAQLPARLLSAGQRRRLALARLLAAKATLWILDEALSSLDDAGAALAQELVGEHLKTGGMTVITTHQDLNLSASSMQRIDLAS
jgi:heme exporter protein A